MDMIPLECIHSNRRCLSHGSKVSVAMSHCTTASVLQAVSNERVNQYAKYGTNSSLIDGTGHGVHWIPAYPHDAEDIERVFREDYDDHGGDGGASWMRLVREEVAEAFQESDPERLEEELIQVAALCVSWVEKLRERRVVTAPGGYCAPHNGAAVVDGSWEV